MSQQLQQLEARFTEIQTVDAAWCRHQLKRVSRRLKQGKPVTRELDRIEKRVEQSTARVIKRQESMPVPDFDPGLPITAHQTEIIKAIRNHQLIIVEGETGSGKTTQLPKFCIAAERGCRGKIACTQPRRIAAQAMAQRVSEELKVELGQLVGYQVRFREKSGANTAIKFMTDGILLAETINDPDLTAYDTIIIDEAHERSLNIDFLLGYLKTLLPRRPDLRVVITSATIDTEKFSQHFEKAPIVRVSGRGYPVELIYQPLDSKNAESDSTDKDLYEGIANAVRLADKRHPNGDVLVFLSGEREIREAREFLSRQSLRNTEILPLYARLSSAEQRRVFHPGANRRIILSTNVAETSLTVPRIQSVIDSGLVRISRYAHRSRIQRLPIEPVSQASANQRKGRCGRISAGTCIRLYSEEDFESRTEFTEPEILRTSLGSVILRMLVMGLGAVEEFPFIDRPAPRMINDAYHLLRELGAIDDNRKVLKLGRELDRWPLDVRLARMVVEADRMGCLEDVLVLAAALSIQDPRERPLNAQQAADESHDQYSDVKSDFSALLRLWVQLRQKRRKLSGNQFRKHCRQSFLNGQRVLEWFDLYQQLRDLARESGKKLSGRHGEYDQVHQALLSGLLSHIGLKHPEDRSYQGGRSNTFYIFPGSGLFGRSPKWIMSAEIVETSRTWGRVNAEIKPEWIEQQGAHLLKRHYFDPHWSRKKGAVMAWEQISLFGLVVVEKRQVSYANIDPLESRRLFILSALVRHELDTRAAFMAHNQTMREEIELMEHKRRKRDVMADENAQFDFFDARIPNDVLDARSFEKWLGQIGEQGRAQLYLGHDVLMRDDVEATSGEQFPDCLKVGKNTLPLTYHFEPGHEADGVSLTVPLELLNILDKGQLQWLVPGLLRDKLIALIRSLPKPLRRSLTPVPVFADALLEALGSGRSTLFTESCSKELSRITGLSLQAKDFDESKIPAHFNMRVVVLDSQGKMMAQSRDLEYLQSKFGSAAQRRFMDRQGSEFNKDQLTQWDFGVLAKTVVTQAGVKAWPALVDQDTGVGLRLFDTYDEAWASHSEGVVRLLSLHSTEKMNFLRKNHGLSKKSLLAWAPVGSVSDLIEDLLWSSLHQCAGHVSEIRDLEQFEQLRLTVNQNLGPVCRRRADLLNQILPVCSQIKDDLAGEFSDKDPAFSADVLSQLDDLIYEGFLSQLFTGRLKHYPRYLAAMEERLTAFRENPPRDQQRMAQVTPWWNRYLDYMQQSEAFYDQSLDDYRWLLEEYRVSVFAQRLGTSGKVSEKRLNKAWQKVVSLR